MSLYEREGEFTKHWKKHFPETATPQQGMECPEFKPGFLEPVEATPVTTATQIFSRPELCPQVNTPPVVEPFPPAPPPLFTEPVVGSQQPPEAPTAPQPALIPPTISLGVAGLLFGGLVLFLHIEALLVYLVLR